MVNRAAALLLLLLLASCSSLHAPAPHMRQSPAPSLQVERQAQPVEPLHQQVAAPLGLLGATGGWVFARRLRTRIRRGQ